MNSATVCIASHNNHGSGWESEACVGKVPWSHIHIYIFLTTFQKKFFFRRLFIFGTERDRAWTGEGQRERGRHRLGNRLQALSHQPRARRGARTPEPRDRDLAEVGRLTDCATQAPHLTTFQSRDFIVNKTKRQITCPSSQVGKWNSCELISYHFSSKPID